MATADDAAFDEIRALFAAAQEVQREAIEHALRVAKERDLDPNALIRTAFLPLQGLALAPRMPGRPPGPAA